MKYSFIILPEPEYIQQTLETLQLLNLEIIKWESAPDIGFFTVEGDPDNIQTHKDFLAGKCYI